MEEKPEYKYAGFGLRMIASVADTIFSLIFVVPLFIYVDKIFQLGFINESRVDISTMSNYELNQFLHESLLSFLYQSTVFVIIVLIFWFARSATPGKILFKMRIIDYKTGKKPSKIRFIVRCLSYLISTLPLCLGFVWIYFDKKKQGWHDKIARTVVIIDEENIKDKE